MGRLCFRPGVRVVIETFLDDSGKESDPSHGFVVLAGYMAGAGWVWERFYQNWRHLLLKHGLEDVHLKWIWAEAKQRGWELSKLNEVLLEFIGAIKDANLIGLGVAVDANAYRALPKERRQKFGDAQQFCCSRIFRRIIDRLRDAGIPDEPISITFDRDWEFARRRLNLIEDLSKWAPGIRENVVQLSFADSRHFYALQAADLLAWHTRRRLADLADGRNRTPRWAELIAVLPYGEMDYAAQEYWSAEKLESALSEIEARHEAELSALKAS